MFTFYVATYHILRILYCMRVYSRLDELSRSRPPIDIIIMSELKVGGTYICTTGSSLLHIIRIIRYFIGSLVDIMQLKS